VHDGWLRSFNRNLPAIARNVPGQARQPEIGVTHAPAATYRRHGARRWANALPKYRQVTLDDRHSPA